MLKTKITLSSFLGDRPFWGNTLRLALPIAIQNLLISSFALVDTMMVSQLGETELSSVGMAGQWAWLLNIFLFGIASGTAIFISQFWGSRDHKSIRQVTGVSLLLSFGVMLCFLLIPLISSTGVISLFNKDAAIIATGSKYLSIALWSYPAVALNSVLSNLLRSTECVRMPMLVSLFSTLLNAGLNWCLIFGIGPFPAMGVEGAAIATVISAWVGPLLLLLCSLATRNILLSSPRQYISAGRPLWKDYAKRALPAIVNEALWGSGTWVVNLIYANAGKAEYAAVTIQRSCEGIAFALIQGLGAACCVMIGKMIGAGQIKEALRDAKRFSFLVPLLSIGIGGILIAARGPLVHFFNMSDNLSETTLQLAYGVILIYSLELPIRNIPYIQVVGIFRSGGEAVLAAVFDLVSLWLLSIPAALIATQLGAPFLVVFAVTYIAEDWLKGIFCILYFRTKRWVKPVTPEGKAGLLAYKKEMGGEATPCENS